MPGRRRVDAGGGAAPSLLVRRRAVLSVAFGTGELGAVSVRDVRCRVTGIDSDERFVRRPREKAATRALSSLVSFDSERQAALPFEDPASNGCFAGEAICEFFHNGAPPSFTVSSDQEARCPPRSSKSSGTTAIPPRGRARWTEGTAVVLTLSGNCEAFERQGFAFASPQYHEPAWWERYYEDRGPARGGIRGTRPITGGITPTSTWACSCSRRIGAFLPAVYNDRDAFAPWRSGHVVLSPGHPVSLPPRGENR